MDNMDCCRRRVLRHICRPRFNCRLHLSSLLLLFVVLLCPATIVSVQGSETACETRVINDAPPPPPNLSKMDDLLRATSRHMAIQLGEFLGTIPEDLIKSKHSEIQTKAITIAKKVLTDEPTILATGIAVASVQLAVMQFQSSVVNADSWEEAQKKRDFLSMYWRSMGSAWNRTGDTEQWGLPFRDCGPVRQRWLWPYTASIKVEGFKLVTALFMSADSDPCITSDLLAMEFYGRQRHACNSETEVCTPVRSHSGDLIARVESFACDCRPGYMRQPPSSSSSADNATVNSGECISCLQLKNGVICNSTSGSQVGGDEDVNANMELYLAEEVAALSLETLMNATIGAIIGSCIVTSLGLSMIVYRKRKFKTIAMSMWTILETIIVGIVIMYAAVLLHFLEASTMRCLLEPWFRELGFVICYGAITLKLYRHLIEFRTRKAHRCVVRDVDLLKYLCAMIVAVLCYLSAFTASSLDFVEHSQLDNGLRVESNLCRPLKWDYVTEAGEMAILLFGLYLSYISRNAKTMFQERNFLVAAIIIEFVVSINFYIFRAVYVDRLSAQVLFLCLVVRSQLTNTVTLGLVFLPKLLHPQKKGMNESAFRSGTSAGPNLSAGDPDIGEVTLSEMNPEEIRKELKRLYTQLEILKNKTLRLDNPHISKRRGGRKTHRRFSLQKKGSKDKALHAKNRANLHHDAEITEAEPSRTPEDSVCSVEGPTEMVLTSK